MQVGTFEVLTVEQPSAPLEASHSIRRHSSRSDMAKERHARPGPLSSSREAPELDSLISFYERQRVSDKSPQEPVLAACNPLCPAGPSAFAANCGTPAAAEDNTSESNDGERHGSQPVLGNEVCKPVCLNSVLTKSPFSSICRDLTWDHKRHPMLS